MVSGEKLGYKGENYVSQSLDGGELALMGSWWSSNLSVHQMTRKLESGATSAFGSVALHWGPWAGTSAGARRCCLALKPVPAWRMLFAGTQKLLP